MSDVGAYLKKIRVEQKLSLKVVKDRTGISDSALSHIESGKTESPSPEQLKKLAAVYRIDLIGLFMKAGYLDRTDLVDYQLCFLGADSLSEKEHNAIQSIISIIINESERY